MSLYGRFTRVGPSGFGHASTAEQVSAGLDLSGQTWLVTGSNSGLGAETCRVLSARGARVLATARTEDKAKAAVAAARCRAPGAARTSSVRRCVAAVRIGPPGRHHHQRRCDGAAVAGACYGMKQFFVNHVAHFVLVTEPSTSSRQGASSASTAARAPTRPAGHPAGPRLRGATPGGLRTIRGQPARTELARRLGDGTGQMACAVHPGVIMTSLLGTLASPTRGEEPHRSFSRASKKHSGCGRQFAATPRCAASASWTATWPRRRGNGANPTLRADSRNDGTCGGTSSVMQYLGTKATTDPWGSPAASTERPCPS